MIMINGKQYRNLEEQVAKNQADIEYLEKSGRTLSLFGIEVLDIVADVSDIPCYNNPDSYTGKTGDAFGVGASAPYILYVYTTLESGKTNYTWLNLGQFPAEGPIGPQGPEGPQGKVGNSRIMMIQPTAPLVYPYDSPHDIIEGDLWMDLDGVVWRWYSTGWSSLTCLKGVQGSVGPQGERGPKGEKGETGSTGPRGETGTVMKVIGKWSYTVSELEDHPLPNPAMLNNMNYAYLVPEDSNHTKYDTFIQVGKTVDDAIWSNIGPIAGGTDVLVSGEFVGEFDADTKQDTLKSGTNIKTVNGQSLLGSGNVTISGGANLTSVNTDIVPASNKKYNIGSTSKIFNIARTNICAANRIMSAGDDNGRIQLSSTILPMTDNNYSLGTSGKEFKEIYTKNLYIDGSAPARMVTMYEGNISGNLQVTVPMAVPSTDVAYYVIMTSGSMRPIIACGGPEETVTSYYPTFTGMTPYAVSVLPDNNATGISPYTLTLGVFTSSETMAISVQKVYAMLL